MLPTTKMQVSIPGTAPSTPGPATSTLGTPGSPHPTRATRAGCTPHAPATSPPAGGHRCPTLPGACPHVPLAFSFSFSFPFS